MTNTEEENKLYDQLGDVRFDMMEEVSNLINAKWDSKTLEKKIENLLEKTMNIHKEIDKVKGKQE